MHAAKDRNTLFMFSIITTMAVQPWSAVCGADTCAVFEFPTLTKRQLTGVEKSLTNFTFVLKTTCGKHSTINIQVSKNNIRQCDFLLENNVCVDSDHWLYCTCTAQPGSFLFTKSVDMSDSTEWIWEAFDDQMNKIAEDSISFEIKKTVPPKIGGGNFQRLKASAGDNVHVNYTLQAQSANITKCQLSRSTDVFASADDTSKQHCGIRVASAQSGEPSDVALDPNASCLCSLTGATPNLTLDVQISNIKTWDSGLWHLTLINEDGSDEKDLFLEVTSRDGESAGVHELEHEVMHVLIPIIAVSGVVVSTIIIFVVVKMAIGRKTHEQAGKRNAYTGLIPGDNIFDESRQCVHLYKEIEGSIYDEIEDYVGKTEMKPPVRPRGTEEETCSDSYLALISDEEVQARNQSTQDISTSTRLEIGNNLYLQQSEYLYPVLLQSGDVQPISTEPGYVQPASVH